MVEKLRKRYIIVSMLAILAVMACIIGAIYAVNVVQRNNRSDEMLRYIAERSGQLEPLFPGEESQPPFGGDGEDIKEDGRSPGARRGGYPGYGSLNIDAETPFRTRFFSVSYTGGICTGYDLSHIAAVTEAEAQGYGDTALQTAKASGTAGGYRYLVTEDGDSAVIYFLDISEDVRATGTYLRGSLLVAGISYLVLFGLIYFISKAAVRPIAANIEAQKRFITDAEHEIKTPLAIISANTEVLEMIHGKSEWTTNILDQVKRSSELVQRLLILSRADSPDRSAAFTEFSISDAVLETVAPFSAVASSAGKALSAEIQPGISFRGDERSIRELVSVLTDNAIKYCTDGGAVTVSLARDGKKTVLRTVNDVPDGFSIDTERLFNRFYRGDESRSRESGGYGIGLSIARAVVEAHHGTIHADVSGNRIIFTVSL